MSRTRISNSARRRYVDCGKMYRKPSSLRSHRLSLLSQDLLDDAVSECLRMPELQDEYTQSHGSGVASKPFDAEDWYCDFVDVLADYDWQLGEACAVRPAKLNSRWTVSHVPTAWDDLRPAISLRNSAFDRKAKQCGISSAEYCYMHEWCPTACYAYSFLTRPFVKTYVGTRLRSQCTHFDVLLPAGVQLKLPAKSPLLGKLVCVACGVGSQGMSAWRVRCKQHRLLPRGWLLLSSLRGETATLTLDELTNLKLAA